MASWKKTSTTSSSDTSSRQSTKSESTTRKVLDEALLETIMGGLTGRMSEAEIRAFAENLLAPQLRAGLEAAQMQYETTELAKTQEIENLAAQLAGSIRAQESAYARSMADVQTAALARGMGRSSYTIQTLAGQGRMLSDAVRELTQESARRSEQIRAQITQAAQQNAKTQGRLNTDYAAQLAAKIQEISAQERAAHDSQYLTAISAAMGSQTTGRSETTGESHTSSKTSSTTTSGRSGGSGGGSKTAQKRTVSAASPNKARKEMLR